MTNVITAPMLANGLRSEFDSTYLDALNRQQDGRLYMVMDLGVGATNRKHEFAYFEAAPHMEYWERGQSIPTDAFGSKSFEVPVYNWAKRIPWHKDDREDDQTQSLMAMAAECGKSAALVSERMFFNLLTNTADFLPAVPLAPDGAAMFSGTDGASANRFGISNGNLLSGSGLASSSAILGDYYSAIEQFLGFQDGQGQPLFSDQVVSSGAIVIHAAADTEAMETAFLQKRQGLVYGSNTAAATPTNIVLDASRDVTLWGSPRLATGDWYVFLKGAPMLPTFYMERKALQEFTALEGDNNSDSVRSTGYEYIQWEMRAGAGIALPYGAIKINN